MKKYNLSQIMKRAWELVKKLGWTISQGLKRAWKEAKAIQVEAAEVSLEEQVIAKLQERINIASDVYNYEIQTNLWENYGKSRTYFKVVETRNHSKHYGVRDYGYIDNQKNVYVAGKNDAFGKYDFSGNVM